MTAKQKTILIWGGIVCTLVVLVGLLVPTPKSGHQISKRQFSEVTMMYLLTASDAYYKEYADWPKGNLTQVVRTLSGDNPRKIVFLQLDRRFINSHGEPTDAWGTTLMMSFTYERVSITSAGKDKTFETSDDISHARSF